MEKESNTSTGKAQNKKVSTTLAIVVAILVFGALAVATYQYSGLFQASLFNMRLGSPTIQKSSEMLDMRELNFSTVCGNRVKEGSEECDDGNINSGDGCSPSCVVEPSCYGVVCQEQGTVCHNGSCTDLCVTSSMKCSEGISCRLGQCMGDSCTGVVCPSGKVCKDGRCDFSYTISDNCTGVACSPGSICRDGGCVSLCGNGIIDSAVEQCDSAPYVIAASCPYGTKTCCSSKCLSITGPVCGDGLVQAANGETCDGANAQACPSSKKCSQDCKSCIKK